MSNPTVSFRISDYHLARGLRAIRTLEPTWQLTTPANLIKTIFIDYIAKSEHLNKTSLTISQELLQEIAFARTNLNNPNRQYEQNNVLPQLGKNIQLTKEQLHQASQKIQRELEDEKLFNALRQEALEKAKKEQSERNEKLEQEIEVVFQPPKKIMHQAPTELETDSEINTVTDFSPPKDWII